MTNQERFALIRRKAILRAELLVLTDGMERVEEILIEIHTIDGRLGA